MRTDVDATLLLRHWSGVGCGGVGSCTMRTYVDATLLLRHWSGVGWGGVGY